MYSVKSNWISLFWLVVGLLELFVWLEDKFEEEEVDPVEGVPPDLTGCCLA